MILGGDKKKVAALIVSRIRPQGDVENMKASNQEAFDKRAAEGEGGDKDDGLLSASEEIIAAIHNRDAQGLVEALKSFCDMDPGESEQDEPSGEE